MSEFLEGVGKLIIFCVVIGFLNGIAATYCCSAVVFVRFVGHEVDFAEEPMIVGDRLKLCHLSVLEVDGKKSKRKMGEKGFICLLLLMMLEFTDHFVSLIISCDFEEPKKEVEWVEKFRVISTFS